MDRVCLHRVLRRGMVGPPAVFVYGGGIERATLWLDPQTIWS